jgi:hypothetical protein
MIYASTYSGGVGGKAILYYNEMADQRKEFRGQD